MNRNDPIFPFQHAVAVLDGMVDFESFRDDPPDAYRIGPRPSNMAYATWGEGAGRVERRLFGLSLSKNWAPAHAAAIRAVDPFSLSELFFRRDAARAFAPDFTGFQETLSDALLVFADAADSDLPPCIHLGLGAGGPRIVRELSRAMFFFNGGLGGSDTEAARSFLKTAENAAIRLRNSSPGWFAAVGGYGEIRLRPPNGSRHEILEARIRLEAWIQLEARIQTEDAPGGLS